MARGTGHLTAYVNDMFHIPNLLRKPEHKVGGHGYSSYHLGGRYVTGNHLCKPN